MIFPAIQKPPGFAWDSPPPRPSLLMFVSIKAVDLSDHPNAVLFSTVYLLLLAVLVVTHETFIVA